MDNELQIEAMERNLQEMQEQLSEMKKVKEKDKVSYAAMLPDSGCFWLSASNFESIESDTISAAKANIDQNIFPSEEVAEAYGDAFRVMLELRRCEGAGHYFEEHGEEYGWIVISNGYTECRNKDFPEMFTLFPPFPTAGLAQQAINNVGKERIIAAMKTLANIKD